MKVNSLTFDNTIYEGFNLSTTIPAPVTDMHFAIVKMLPNPNQTFPNEVMAAAVNDQDVPVKFGKGATIPCRAWFDIMSMIMTAPALKWAIEPNMLWINERYYGDSFWPDVDPQGNAPDAREPIAECLAYPCNFIAWDYRLGDWFHLLSYDYLSPPTNPYKDNWFMKPWLWHKAQARNIKDDHLSNVGAGLDVYLPIIKKTAHTWMHLSQLELFPALPYTLDDGNVIIRYELQGADVIGHTRAGTFIYLRKVGKFTGTVEPYSWHLQQRGVIPPT